MRYNLGKNILQMPVRVQEIIFSFLPLYELASFWEAFSPALRKSDPEQLNTTTYQRCIVRNCHVEDTVTSRKKQFHFRVKAISESNSNNLNDGEVKIYNMALVILRRMVAETVNMEHE